jgi:hypothetical protein
MTIKTENKALALPVDSRYFKHVSQEGCYDLCFAFLLIHTNQIKRSTAAYLPKETHEVAAEDFCKVRVFVDGSVVSLNRAATNQRDFQNQKVAMFSHLPKLHKINPDCKDGSRQEASS